MNRFQTENKKIISEYKIDSKTLKRLREYRRRKASNAHRDGIGFHLGLTDILDLCIEAGITIWDVGNAKYVLGRYGDTGPYEIGNCRFITQQENIKEWWDSVDKKEWAEMSSNRPY